MLRYVFNFKKGLIFFFRIVQSNFNCLRRPYKLLYVVTKRCQSRCKNCSIWEKPIRDELSLLEIEKIAKGATFISWLSLTGGEPTLRRDLFEIVQIFYRNCPNLYILNLTTNGMDPEGLYKTCLQMQNLGIPRIFVTISIDGPPTVNDSIRGVKNHFAIAIEAFQKLQNLKGIRTFIGMTLFAENASLVSDTYQAIKKEVPRFSSWQLHVNLGHVSEHFYSNDKVGQPSRGVDVNEYTLALKFGSKSSRYLYNSVSFMERIYRKKAKEFLATGKSPLRCTAATTSVYMSEKGDLYPCTIWNQKIGNLRDQQYLLTNAIDSTGFDHVRTEVLRGNCPQCWSPCEAFQSIGAQLFRSSSHYSNISSRRIPN